MSLKVAGWKLHKRSFFGPDLGLIIGPDQHWNPQARPARITKGFLGWNQLWMTRADYERMEKLSAVQGEHLSEVLLKALLSHWDMCQAWSEFAQANHLALEVEVDHLHHPEKNLKRVLRVSDGFPFTNEKEKKKNRDYQERHDDSYYFRGYCPEDGSSFDQTSDYTLVRPELYKSLSSYVDEFSKRLEEATKVIYKARSLADSFVRDQENREKLRREMLVGVDVVAGEKALRRLDASVTELGLEHIQKLEEDRELEQKAYVEGAKRWRELNA